MPRSVVMGPKAIRMDELEDKFQIWQEVTDKKTEQKMDQNMDEMKTALLDEMRNIMSGFFSDKGKGTVNEEVEGNMMQEGQEKKV
ncbi:hypothetical protein GH714_023936 [Hevea brasiliensis]|uniref:Uncharacterized protein n=1 Tax=Hevea brasiliensis TaxID=3981 RepID=A0A6A6LMC3_HEVBR|nr:hypothetical protein GH714_023936 [Hevea brasiliensis]